MSCLAIIRSARDEMSANEKKLADFVLENAPLIRDYSSQQIAGSVGVSQSSVVKFSQKLGYKGFTDLKLAIHESVVKQGSNISVLRGKERSSSGSSSLRERLFHSKCDALSSVTDLNDDERIFAGARAIKQASRVELVGSGAAHLIAKDFAYKLMGMGKVCIAEGDAQMQLTGISALRSGDCLVIISASGQAPELVKIAKRAKKEGVVIVSLTSQSASPIRTLADVRLFSVSRGQKTDIQSVIEATSQQHIIDLLYYVLSKNTERLSGSGEHRIAKVVKS
jgi:DNA-binding MurR/RpiR family transcriptional regulator